MTLNQQTVEGTWNQLKGKIRGRWGQLTDNELDEARGDVEYLVGLIQEKTGEARGEIESFLANGTSGIAAFASQATEAIVDRAQHVVETAQQAGERAVDAARSGYAHTEALVRDRPVESLVTSFGIGLITGVVVGMLARGR